MDPMDRLSAQEEMDARIAKKSGSGDKSKPLVLTKRILKPAERRVLAKLKDQVKTIKSNLNEETVYRSLNPEDYPVRSSPTEKQKQESLKREEGLRMQLKSTNRMISKVKGGALVPKSLLKTAGSVPSFKSGLGAAVARWNELFQTN